MVKLAGRVLAGAEHESLMELVQDTRDIAGKLIRANESVMAAIVPSYRSRATARAKRFLLRFGRPNCFRVRALINYLAAESQFAFDVAKFGDRHGLPAEYSRLLRTLARMANVHAFRLRQVIARGWRLDRFEN